MGNGNSRRWLASVAKCAIVTISFFAVASEASAQATCSFGATSFSCDDGDETTPVATGTYAADYKNVAGYGGLNFTGPNDITIDLLSGDLHDTAGWHTLYAYSSGGDVHFNSTGIVSNSGGRGVALQGLNVDAQIGTVLITNAIPYTTMVDLYATAGSVNLIGGTIVSDAGYGIRTLAVGGDVHVDSGDVTVTDHDGWGILSGTASSTNGSCGTNVVNLTGNVTAPLIGVLLEGCGAHSLTVEQGRSLKMTQFDGAAVDIIGQDSVTMNVAGSIVTSPSGLAITARGSSANTTIFDGGNITGRVDYYTTENLFQIRSGGTWTSSGTSHFSVGHDAVLNEGRIVTAGPTTFTGLETLTNAGIIDTQNGVTGDVLTISGDYVGSAGAAIRLDADDIAADRLVIGGSARGLTSLFVNTSVLISNPLLVVDTGSSEAGAFVLGDTSATPLIDLNLSVVGDDYYVTAVPSSAALRPLRVGMAARSLWYQSADAVFAQNRTRSLKRARRTPLSLWAQGADITVAAGLIAGQSSSPLSASTSRYRGIQGGVGYYLGERSVVGVTVGYMPGTVDSLASAEGLNTSNSNFGVYGLFGSATGFHAGVIAKHERNAIRLTTPAFARAEGGPSTSTSGIEAEAGTRTPFLGGRLDVDVGLAYVRNDVQSFAAEGLAFELNSSSSVRGRLGIRLDSGKENGIFVSAKLYHEFAGDEKMRLASARDTASVRTDGSATSARLELGIGGSSQLSPGLSSWIELGGVKALGLSAGLRL